VIGLSLLRRRPVDLWRNLCASLLYFVVRVTVAISSTDELLVFTADVFTVAVFPTYVDVFYHGRYFLNAYLCRAVESVRCGVCMVWGAVSNMLIMQYMRGMPVNMVACPLSLAATMPLQVH